MRKEGLPMAIDLRLDFRFIYATTSLLLRSTPFSILRFKLCKQIDPLSAIILTSILPISSLYILPSSINLWVMHADSSGV